MERRRIRRIIQKAMYIECLNGREIRGNSDKNSGGTCIEGMGRHLTMGLCTAHRSRSDIKLCKRWVGGSDVW